MPFSTLQKTFFVFFVGGFSPEGKIRQGLGLCFTECNHLYSLLLFPPSPSLQKEQLERLVLAPLTCLQGMFSGPQKLIQKRYDKLLDYCSRLERSSSFNSTFSSSYSSNPSSASSSSSSPSPSSSSPSPVSDAHLPARRDYVALNGQLVEELQRFNEASHTILVNCVVFLVALLRGLTDTTRHNVPSKHQLPVRVTGPCAVTQNDLRSTLIMFYVCWIWMYSFIYVIIASFYIPWAAVTSEFLMYGTK